MDDTGAAPETGTAGSSERDRLRRLAGTPDGNAAIPAATVVLVRAGADREPVEVLMLRRDSKLAFAGGLWVFPGGRVDAEDYPPDAPDDLAAAELRAAAREAAEEAGLVVDPTGFVRLSHWTPPPQAHRRFTTAFFVAPAPEGEVVVDDGEIRAHRWVGPEAALDAHRSGEIELAPPTFITLLQLSGHPDVPTLVDSVAAAPTEHFATRIALVGDHVIALYHGDVAYEDATHGEHTLRDGPRHRLWLDGGGWRYERDLSAD